MDTMAAIAVVLVTLFLSLGGPRLGDHIAILAIRATWYFCLLKNPF